MGPKELQLWIIQPISSITGCLLPRKLRAALWNLTPASSVPGALYSSGEAGAQRWAPGSGSKPETAVWHDLQPRAPLVI